MQTKPTTSDSKRDCSKPLPMKAGLIMVMSIVVSSVILAFGISSGNALPAVMLAWWGMMFVPLIVVRLVHAGRIK